MDAFERILKSYSTFVENFYRERLSYLPPHDIHDVVADPLQYRGGPLRYTERVDGFDGFARQILELAETLARTGANPGANGAGHHAAAGHPLLSVAVFNPGGRGIMRECDTGAGPAARHEMEFPLDLHPDAVSLRLRILCDPGMLEITRFSLVWPGPAPVEESYDVHFLRKNLAVISDAAVLHSGNVYRLLISREPAVLEFQNWKKEGLPPPVALRMEARYHEHLEKPILLHPAALNAMNRHSAEREITLEKMRLFQEKLKYTIGNIIDFSAAGDAILYTREGWCNPEPWGTWTHGHEAVLVILLKEIPKRAVTVNASVKGLVIRGHDPVSVEVHVNGGKIAAWSMANAGFKPFRFKIPPGKIQSPECVIAFKILNPRTPEQLGLSDDKRLLGLGFGKMSLDW